MSKCREVICKKLLKYRLPDYYLIVFALFAQLRQITNTCITFNLWFCLYKDSKQSNIFIDRPHIFIQNRKEVHVSLKEVWTGDEIADRMAWSNETALRFLELYRSHPCIWDPKHVSHKDKSKHNKAWVDIKNKLGGSCTIKELKRKKDSLMASYRSYRTKIKKFELSRKGTSNLYEPSWFAYSYMDTFLGSVYKCKVSMNIEDDQYECKKEYIARVYDTNNIDASNVEVDSVVASSQQHPGKYKRRRYKPAETQQNEVDLQQAKDQMDQAYQILKSVSLVTQEQHSDKDDECIIFGKLIAKKLRKLTEDRRDLMMIKINQLFYEEFYER